jgi:sugar transferase (PEP-CTERM system associated)
VDAFVFQGDKGVPAGVALKADGGRRRAGRIMVRVFHHYFSGRKLLLFLSETVAITVACLAGAMALSAVAAKQSGILDARHVLSTLLLLCVGFVASLQFMLYLQDLYDLRVAGEDRVKGNRFLRAAGTTVLVMAAAAFVAPLQIPPGALMGSALGALTGVLGVRVAFRAVVGAPSRILLVGDGVRATSLCKLIEDHGEGMFKVVAKIDPPREGAAATLPEPMHVTAKRLNANMLVVACDEPRGAKWVDEVLACRVKGYPVYDAPGLCERVMRRLPVAQLRASDLVFAEGLRVSRFHQIIKRGLDLLMAGTLALLAAPVMALVAVLIKLDSKGPVFYRQERMGLGGRSYHLWKFRSMRTDAEKGGAVWAKTNDDRVTRVGRFIRKTRIDEIPQVFNILNGDMSFVGPRPERPVFVSDLKKQIPFYEMREMVKPGLTGWAQIRYPYGASVEDARNKLEYDLYYVKNGSVFLDLAIVFHTVRHVLQGRGAR